MTVTAGERVAVHQFIATLEHDDVGTHTLRLRDALRRAGRRSEIFAETIHDDLAGEAFAHWTYPEHSTPGDVAVYQVTTPSVLARYLAEHGLPLILDLHDDTGPEDYAGWEPGLVERATRATEELAELAPQALVGLARGRSGTRARCNGPTAGAPSSSQCSRTRRESPPLPTRGWPPNWHVAAPKAAPTSCLSGPSGPRMRSTSWSRRSGPSAGSTTGAPACTWSAVPPATSTPGRCWGSCRTSGLRRRSGCTVRSRTPRSPPSTPTPTSTSRCPRTKVRPSRSSRR